MIEIKCSTKDTLNLSEITEFQGNLKERDNTDYEKIERSIRKHGFSFPFFIWKHDGVNHCLDGHGRLGAIKRLVAQGEKIPPLPVVYVDCKDEADAKELLLKLNSHYGQMTAQSVADFLGDLKIDFADLALPEGILDLSSTLLPEETINDDETPDVELEEEPDSKPGMVYELGEHRLMCGDSTSAEDIVLDPFGGSGTTIIASAKTNRIARVMELDPHYCDVIRKRWTAWAKENGKEIGSGGLE